MKATGIVRRIDELGRIVLPIELRRTMDIEERDRVEIYLEGDLIIVRKFEQTCLFRGAARNLIALGEKRMQGLHPRTQQKSRRLKEEPHMHRQRKHRTYGVSAVCRKSAGIEKAYRLRFCALHPDTERGRSSADGAIRRDRAGTVCLILSPHRHRRCKNTKITVTGTAATMEAAIMYPPSSSTPAEELQENVTNRAGRSEPYRHRNMENGGEA